MFGSDETQMMCADCIGFWKQLRPIGFEKLDITIVSFQCGKQDQMDALSSITVGEKLNLITWDGWHLLGRSCQQITFVVWLTAGENSNRKNSPLRAVINGKLVSVSETLYDTLILRELDTLDDEFRESVLVGQVLGKNQLGIGDGWIALRVEQFIKEGLLLPITTPAPNAPIYHRMLKKIK